MLLSPFSGKQKDFFLAYRNAYLTLAQQSSSLCQFSHGLLGFVLLTPEEHQTLRHIMMLMTYQHHLLFAHFLDWLEEPALAHHDASALLVSRHHNAERLVQLEVSPTRTKHHFRKQQIELNTAFK